MAVRYLDTCSVLAWASASLQNGTSLDADAAKFIRQLSADPNERVFVSEITLIEFYDNVALWHRRGDNGADEAWIGALMDEMMGWLGSGRWGVLSPVPKLYESAMRYVRMNLDAGKFKFRSMDAAHLVYAVALARRLGEPVDLVSYDTDFTKLFVRYPAFARFVVQVDPRTGADLTAR